MEPLGELSVEQKVDCNLGDTALGGPRIVRQVLIAWCRRNPEQARDLALLRYTGDDAQYPQLDSPRKLKSPAADAGNASDSPRKRKSHAAGAGHPSDSKLKSAKVG
jgi:hypothetical protein